MYVEIFRYFKELTNKTKAIFIAGIVVTVLEVLNLYAILAILKKLLSLDFAGYFFSLKTIPLVLFWAVSCINIVICYTIGNRITNTLDERFYKPQLRRYVIVTCLAFILGVSLHLLTANTAP